MEKFSEVISAIVKNNQEPSWLKDLRLSALDQFQNLPQPLKTDEDWRRTDINKILFSDLNVETAAVPFAKKIDWTHAVQEESDASILSGNASELHFFSLTQAVKEIPEIVRPYLELSQKQNQQKYCALSNALWNGGIFLHVPKNQNVELPLAAVLRPFLSNQNGGRKSFFSKLIIALDENSWVTLIADETKSSEWEGWIDGTMEAYLKQDAHLSLVKTDRGGRNATELSNFYARLEQQASLNLITLNMGSALVKSNLNVDLCGEGASADLFGLVKGSGAQHFDQTVYVSHQAPHTSSDVLFKTAMKDKSRSIFTGLIHVRKNAVKTDAHQTNRNLLLSKEARADTIPKLEIEIDDVKCGHGAAVSSVDPEQLYYIMSRGLSREEAETIIIEGFYEDVLAQWAENASTKSKDAILSWLRGVVLGASKSMEELAV